jgi:hypothetical protein
MDEETELTEQIPAQERVATSGEEVPPLPATQILAETQRDGEIRSPVFIP